jgi:hypothetical protein
VVVISVIENFLCDNVGSAPEEEDMVIKRAINEF